MLTMRTHKKSEGFILPLVAVFMVIISLILASMLETEAHYEALHAEFVHDQQLRAHHHQGKNMLYNSQIKLLRKIQS